jgi:DNA-binding MarR family transcriptional regulator
MKNPKARQVARQILHIVPQVMRTLTAELQAARELSAPVHFALLSMISERPRNLTELARLRGVSLPTMSNSVSALAARGWVRRSAPAKDRRVIVITLMPSGRAALGRVRRSVERHLARRLAALDASGTRRLRQGLATLQRAFGPSAERGRAKRAGAHRPPKWR